MVNCTWCWNDCKKKNAYKCSAFDRYICHECMCDNILNGEQRNWPKCCEIDGNIDYTYIKNVCSKDLDKLNTFVMNYDEDYITKKYNVKYCPKHECGHAFTIGNKCDPDKLKCANKQCKHKWCTVCMKEWKRGHKKVCKGVTDLQKMITKIDDKKKKTKRKPSKLCPHCNSLITKTKGCRHMKCGWCSFEFCWNCLKKYNHCYCYMDY